MDETLAKAVALDSPAKGNETSTPIVNRPSQGMEVDPPSGDDIRFAISKIIAEVTDFETTTYRDIRYALEQQFGIDFSERKVELRKMIEDELTKLVENEEEDEEVSNAVNIPSHTD